MPHNHQMWAVIGIYTGREDNIFWRRVRGAPGRSRRGGRSESVERRRRRATQAQHHPLSDQPDFALTAAIHVYGGDFFAAERRRMGCGKDGAKTDLMQSAPCADFKRQMQFLRIDKVTKSNTDCRSYRSSFESSEHCADDAEPTSAALNSGLRCSPTLQRGDGGMASFGPQSIYLTITQQADMEPAGTVMSSVSQACSHPGRRYRRL